MPVPDYTALQGVIGGAALSNQAVCKDAVTAQLTRSPLVVLFVVQGDEDHVHVEEDRLDLRLAYGSF